MRPTSAAAIAMAAILLSTPASLAWSSFGNNEPDSEHDSIDFMFMGNGPASADHIYFNAFTATQAAVFPNVGAIGTTNEAPQMERPYALFGVWVDCNGDGYIGHAESALFEYSSAILLNDDTCPPVTSEDPDVWTPGAHNFNGWVTEFVTIGRPPEDLENASDTRLYYDDSALVWGDVHLPWEAPRKTCPLNPFPRGTVQSTGGTLNYLDCRYNVLEQWNGAMSTLGDPLGLTFPNPNNAQDSWADFETFGSDHSNEAAVSVFDCREDPFFDSAEAVNESGLGIEEQFDAAEEASGEEIGDGWEYYGFRVWPVNPRAIDSSSPTAPGQFNQTFEEVGDCDFSNDDGNDFYGTLNEGQPVGDADQNGKSVSDWPFFYAEGNRGDLEDFYGLGLETVTVPEDAGTAGMVPWLGIGALQPQYGSSWFGSGNLVKQPPERFTPRVDLGGPGVAPPARWMVTYYAYTSLVGVSFGEVTLKAPGGSGTYGSPHCGDESSGVHGGWECDSNKWNKNADGAPLDGNEFRASVGQVYNFRDIDCYDGRTSAGVPLGLAALADDRCQPYDG